MGQLRTILWILAFRVKEMFEESKISPLAVEKAHNEFLKNELKAEREKSARLNNEAQQYFNANTVLAHRLAQVDPGFREAMSKQTAPKGELN